MLRRFLVTPDSISGGVAVLDEAQSRHAVQVLRMKSGDEVVVGDGTSEWRGRIAKASKNRVEIALDAEQKVIGAERLKLILAPAAIRSNRMDLVIEKATELGVSVIAPFVCERSVAKPDRAKIERWCKIALAAAQQSGRTGAPEILETASFEERLEIPADIRIIFSETKRSEWFDDAIVLWEKLKSKDEVVVVAMIGPEGGFTAAEIEAARKKSFIVSGLGPTILRAETASIAALATLRFAFR